LTFRIKKKLNEVFLKYSGKIHTVIHFAGLKAVGESNSIPLRYFENNISATLTLLEVMKEHKVKNLVFSSSATVYGDVKEIPEGGLTEDIPTNPTNPYGRTKVFIEEILRDVYNAETQDWNFIILRYFNPVGAHSSGLLGEDPSGSPNNLMPFLTQVAVSQRSHLTIWGNDYNTKDGTGMRDYVHVVDLARGHVASLKKMDENPGYTVYNLGTGVGTTVLDVITAMEKASGTKIKTVLGKRRAGDVTCAYACPLKAKKGIKLDRPI